MFCAFMQSAYKTYTQVAAFYDDDDDVFLLFFVASAAAIALPTAYLLPQLIDDCIIVRSILIHSSVGLFFTHFFRFVICK